VEVAGGNGRAGSGCDALLHGRVVFGPDGTAEYLAVEADSLCRVKHIPAK
jgi:hypothetical protein